jgi:hypothetical protein
MESVDASNVQHNADMLADLLERIGKIGTLEEIRLFK